MEEKKIVFNMTWKDLESYTTIEELVDNPKSYGNLVKHLLDRCVRIIQDEIPPSSIPEIDYEEEDFIFRVR